VDARTGLTVRASLLAVMTSGHSSTGSPKLPWGSEPRFDHAATRKYSWISPPSRSRRRTSRADRDADAAAGGAALMVHPDISGAGPWPRVRPAQSVAGCLRRDHIDSDARQVV
jgi:hypothetical protein